MMDYSPLIVDGDVVINDSGRLVMISGIDSLEQSMSILFHTRFGEDKIFHQMGFPIAQAISLSDEDYISGLVRRTLKQDPRISTVGISSASINGDRVLSIEAIATTQDGSRVVISSRV